MNAKVSFPSGELVELDGTGDEVKAILESLISASSKVIRVFSEAPAPFKINTTTTTTTTSGSSADGDWEIKYHSLPSDWYVSEE